MKKLLERLIPSFVIICILCLSVFGENIIFTEKNVMNSDGTLSPEKFMHPYVFMVIMACLLLLTLWDVISDYKKTRWPSEVLYDTSIALKPFSEPGPTGPLHTKWPFRNLYLRYCTGQGACFLYNVQLPKAPGMDESASIPPISILMLTTHGFFVFNCVSKGKRIIGAADDTEWVSQTNLPNGDIEIKRMNNPLEENKISIENLKRWIYPDIKDNNCPVSHSFAVFENSADFSDMQSNGEEYILGKSISAFRAAQKVFWKSNIRIEQSDLHTLFRKLSPYAKTYLIRNPKHLNFAETVELKSTKSMLTDPFIEFDYVFVEESGDNSYSRPAFASRIGAETSAKPDKEKMLQGRAMSGSENRQADRQLHWLKLVPKKPVYTAPVTQIELQNE